MSGRCIWAPSSASRTQERSNAAPDQVRCGKASLQSHFPRTLFQTCGRKALVDEISPSPLKRAAIHVCMPFTTFMRIKKAQTNKTNDWTSGRKSVSQHPCSAMYKASISTTKPAAFRNNNKQGQDCWQHALLVCNVCVQDKHCRKTQFSQDGLLIAWARAWLIEQPGGESQRAGAVNTCMHLVIRRNEAMLSRARELVFFA